jgi:hypothetical protein
VLVTVLLELGSLWASRISCFITNNNTWNDRTDQVIVHVEPSDQRCLRASLIASKDEGNSIMSQNLSNTDSDRPEQWVRGIVNLVVP